MKTLLLPLTVATLLFNGAKMTVRADSALTVAPFASKYTIREVGIVSSEHYEFQPVIAAFDDKATFTVNADSWGDVFHIRGIPVKSPSLFELPDSFKQGYRIAARNDFGHVVGELNSHVFMWKSGAPQIFPFLRSDDSRSYAQANDVNNKGQIVGESLMQKEGAQYKSATLWEEGQAFELESTPNFWESHALAISDKGQVVGNVERRNGDKPKSKAVQWVNKRVQLLEGEGASAATHINEHGQIAGWWEDPASTNPQYSRRPAIWQNGKKFDLGEVVEFKGRVFAGGVRPLLLDSKIVESQGGYLMEPKGFNNHGQIVGKMRIVSGCVGSDGVFYFDGQLHDLQTLVPKEGGWGILSAEAINNKSQIIGLADHNGKRCVYLLSPASMGAK